MCIFLPSNAYAAAGEIDKSYGISGVAVASSPGSTDNRSRDIAVQADGSTLVVGRCFVENANAYRHCVVRFTSTGEVDSNFANGTGQLRLLGSTDDVYRIIPTNSGGALIAFHCNGGICVQRITDVGDLDQTFAVDGVAAITLLGERDYQLVDLFRDSGERVVVVFRCETSTYDLRFCIARLGAHGALDVGYGVNGLRAIPLPSAFQVRAAGRTADLSDGGRLLAGICSSYSQGNAFLCATRIDRDGNDSARFLAQHESGQYLPATYPRQHWFAFYQTQYIVDFFGTTSIQDRLGNLFVAATCANATYDPCLFKFLPTGRLDTSFGSNGAKSVPLGDGDDIARFHLLDDDKLLVLGSCNLAADQGVGRVCSARLQPTGELDLTYGDSGLRRQLPTLPEGASGYIAGNLQRHVDGSFLGTGEIWTGASAANSARFAVTRLNSFATPSASCGLNADRNLLTAPSTDAMLVTRYLLGFRGDALTVGAIGANPTRTADEIVTYLDSLKNDPLKKLDLDGDGESLATTDGLLMLRAMLGLSGDALTTGAMGKPSAAYPTLRNAQQILQWIETTHGVACLP
jgi:uncharacterized delta-60 repeat protein